MKKLITIAIVALLSINNQTALAHGGSFAAGIVAGAVVTAAASIIGQQPVTVVQQPVVYQPVGQTVVYTQPQCTGPLVYPIAGAPVAPVVVPAQPIVYAPPPPPPVVVPYWRAAPHLPHPFPPPHHGGPVCWRRPSPPPPPPPPRGRPGRRR